MDEQPKRKIRRRSLVIYYKNEKALNNLGDHVRVVYKSTRFKYVIVYLDEKKVFETKKKLINDSGIKEVIDSKFKLETFECA